MRRQLTLVPSSILRAKSTTVEVDTKVLQLLGDLGDTLFAQDAPKGVGLSAPQIGKNWRLFATMLPKNPGDEPTKHDIHLFINPIITNTSAQLTMNEDDDGPLLEGCLSIPNTYGPVPRAEWVEVSYQTLEKGEVVTKEQRFHDFEARVVQHEFDHLEGVLFTDYVLKYDLPLYEYRGKKMIELDKNVVKHY